MKSTVLEAAHAWWLSKRPPGQPESQHKAHPWFNTFGPQETMLAVACADGPDDCIIAAALAWYYSDHRPATVEGKHLDAVLKQYVSTKSSDIEQGDTVMQIMCNYKPNDCHGIMQYTPSEEMGSGLAPVELHHLICPECKREVTIADFGRMDGLGKKKGKRHSTVRINAPSQESEMNLWVVSLPGKCKRFVASQADGREMRDLFMQEYSVKKKDVALDPIQVPTSKPELLQFLNEAYAEIDAAGVQS